MRSLEDPGVRNPSLDSSLVVVADIDPPTAAAENPVLGTQLRIRVVERIRETAPHFVSRRTLLLSSTSTLHSANCTSHPQFPSDSYAGGLRIEILARP